MLSPHRARAQSRRNSWATTHSSNPAPLPRSGFVLRTQRAPAPRPNRQHGRHDNRMVRFPALRTGDGAGLRQAVLPSIRPGGRRAAGVRRLFRRISRPAYRGSDIRPLGRPDRAQGNLDRDIAGDRPCDYGRGAGSNLREHWDLGRRAAGHHPLDPGDRSRWRVGRFGAAGDGMGANQQKPRPPCSLAAVRRAGRTVPGQPGGAVLQLVFR